MFLGIEGRDPGRPAVLTEDGAVRTYGQLCADAGTVARAFTGRPLVFCLCGNGYGSLCGYAGLLSGGAAPLLLDARIRPELLGGLLEAYRPGYLWAPEAVAADFPGWKRGPSLAGCALLETGERPPELYPGLALLMTTSGSTGSPKLVRQSLSGVEANARAIVDFLEIGPDERAATTLPMHYTYGLSILHSHLLAGASVILTGRAVVEAAFWDCFRELGATSFGGVPFTYELLERAGFFEMELPGLRYFTQAGGRLAPALHRRCAEYALAHGKRFYVMYGQTEATARMGYLPWRRSLEKCGRMGIAIPGGRFSLEDADGTEIDAPDTAGELCYSGKNVALGYAERAEDLAKGDEWGGMLHTGDLASRDAEGYYTIVGRKKRFIKLYGSRVSLDRCEQLLRERFPGTDCACTGEDGALRVFLTAEDRCGEARELLAHLLGVHRRAVRVAYLERIPRTAAGKTAYRELEGPT